MDRNEIMTFLPHRAPMLLLDEVMPAGAHQSQGVYHVRGDKFFLQGHFPGMPVVPGVILCEIVAQTAGILVKEELMKGRTPLFAGIEKVRFRRMVRPGDRVDTHCKVLRTVGSLIKLEGEARVDNELCCEGVFLMMLTDIPGAQA
ncbi:MAG: 3-hydroxyacyl-ACP dehydratase FabZ [Clostridiales bacterium]|nr:3-hydroxyacyl-ACP dehydratase FabZ [Clostridiales bacterium]